jgi:hypothetical protein
VQHAVDYQEDAMRRQCVNCFARMMRDPALRIAAEFLVPVGLLRSCGSSVPPAVGRDCPPERRGRQRVREKEDHLALVAAQLREIREEKSELRAHDIAVREADGKASARRAGPLW